MAKLFGIAFLQTSLYFLLPIRLPYADRSKTQPRGFSKP